VSDANKAVVQEFIERVWNHGDLAAAEDLVAAEYGIALYNQAWLAGPQAVRRNVSHFRRAFPDLTITIEELIAEGDRVVALMTLRGTHLGTFRDQYPATGRVVEYREVGIWRVAEGQLRAATFVADAFGLRKQLGVIPEGIA
jgi:steroid delta-isomerase-like uncharacterized protein